jgi:hypothetical protein
MQSHEKLKYYFSKIDKTIQKNIETYKDVELPFSCKSGLEDEWVNRFYYNPIYRHIHLEYYKTNKICVLHSNAFPSPFISEPIMGFDIIALGDRITGLFFDITPIKELDYTLRSFLLDLKKDFKSPLRPLPEWATFFSRDFYCVSPLEEELDQIIDRINDAILFYFEYLNINNSYILKKNVQKQNEYCIGQKKNEKTFNALAAEIGKDNAKLFLDTCLFPEIDLHTL